MGILLLGKGHRLQQLAEFTPSSSDYLQNRATGLNKQVTRKEPDPWPSWGRFAQLLQHKAVTKPAQTAVGGFPWRKRIPEWQRATKATPTQSHSLVPRNPWQLGRHNGARSTCYHSERPKGCSIGQWMAKGAPSIFGSPFGSAQRLAFITSIPSRRCTVGMCAGGTARAQGSVCGCAFWPTCAGRCGEREEGSLEACRGKDPGSRAWFLSPLSVGPLDPAQMRASFWKFVAISYESEYCSAAPYLIWCFR